jgi:nitrite reductase/ring-hydroxylating ferredoxin subunit
MKLVPVGKFGVGVFNVAGKFYGITNYCPHRGAPLCLGRVTGLAVAGPRAYEALWTGDGEVLRCPWHGWEFDITSGTAFSFPEKQIRTYPVTTENDQIILEVL